MHPQVLALGLKLLMTRFVHSVLTFYRVTPSQLSVVAWRTILAFEALCVLFTPEACQREVFSTAYALRTPQDARYFVHQSGLIRLSSIWLTTTMACEILLFG